MLYYAANITLLFRDRPLAERYRRIAEAGFAAYELLFPLRERLSEALDLQQRYGLRLALFDLEVDAEDPLGCLTSPDERAFFHRLEEAIALAQRFDCHRLNALVGTSRSDLSREAQLDLITERLRRGADVAGKDIMLTIEALNRFQHPSYFLHSSQLGVDIVRAVGRPNVRFQYDYYHMQINEGNLIDTVRQQIAAIGHVQIADVPGRHEPGTGEINYPNVLQALQQAGYDGYVGLEYVESSPQADPFAWLPLEERSRRQP